MNLNNKLRAPSWEFKRSLAATRVAEMAIESGLFLSHYEYRVALDVPEVWLPEGRTDLGAASSWQNGILAEQKYHYFRNDQLLGSFHPHHQSAWSTHELCHGLVGYAWQPNAGSLFHALAARLAELLPVTLFYFYDDASSARCWMHEFARPLFGSPCPRCERESMTKQRPLDPERIAAGQRFLDRELAAIEKSKKLGRMVPNHWGTLDLASDGLAYAAANLTRLQSSAFERYVAQFVHKNQGRHNSLEALEARILDVSQAILEPKNASPWQSDPTTWIAQDLGNRLIQIWMECEGDSADEIDHIIEHLACNPQAIKKTVADYEALSQEYVVPAAEDVFAVGYPLLEGWGKSRTQILAGLWSACPTAMEQIDQKEGRLDKTINAFMDGDEPERRSLAHRFANWLKHKDDNVAHELALFEATIGQSLPVDQERLSLAVEPTSKAALELAADCRLVHLSVAASQILGIGDGTESLVAIQPNGQGEVDVKLIDPEWAAGLIRGETPDGLIRELLIESSVLVPSRYELS